jgi:hypothetical protein
MKYKIALGFSQAQAWAFFRERGGYRTAHGVWDFDGAKVIVGNDPSKFAGVEIANSDSIFLGPNNVDAEVYAFALSRVRF